MEPERGCVYLAWWGRVKTVSWTEQLAEELHKLAKRRFPTRRVRVGGVDNTWFADLVDMPSFSKYNDVIKYLLTSSMCSASTRGLAIPLVDNTGKNIVRAFETIPKRKLSRL